VNDPRIVLALDVGGTHMRAAAVDAAGRLHSFKKARTHLSRLSSPSRRAVEAQVVTLLEDFLRPLHEAHPDARAACLGFPGFFHSNGILAASPNIPRLRDFDLASRLGERLGMDVHVQNDALLAAIGEFHFGAGQGHRHLLHITLGTGIGGGAILNGKAWHGEGGMAMEIGHLRVEPSDSPDARICGCGNSGCLEAYASARAVVARYAEKSGGTTLETAEQVYHRARAGDEVAQRLLEDAGRRLGQALAEAAKLLDIRHISIGGGLSGAWDVLYPPLCRGMEDGLIPPLQGNVNVHRSTLGDHAGLLGAATYTGATARP